MDRGVIYLLTGPAHAARLVVSLWTLRRHFDGPVTIYTTHPASHEVGKRCAADERLRVSHKTFWQVNTPRNSSFLTKLELLDQVPYSTAVYLDADTLVTGNILPLFEAAEKDQFAATQFSTWITSGRTIRKRIEAWRNIQQDVYDPVWFAALVEEATRPAPAVNGGVFGFRSDSDLLPEWKKLAYTGCETFICDEIALQLLLPRFSHQVLDCRFNCSPIYAKHQGDVRIWHFHGEKHVGRENCRQRWLPAYEICLSNKIASIQEWTPCGDRRLEGFLKKRKGA